MSFKFKLGCAVVIHASNEEGDVIGRSEHSFGENQYLLRYCAADGRAVEAWWSESALRTKAICPTCGGRGEYRAPYARERTECPDCTARPGAPASQD